MINMHSWCLLRFQENTLRFVIKTDKCRNNPNQYQQTRDLSHKSRQTLGLLLKVQVFCRLQFWPPPLNTKRLRVYWIIQGLPSKSFKFQATAAKIRHCLGKNRGIAKPTWPLNIPTPPEKIFGRPKTHLKHTEPKEVIRCLAVEI